jgi:hypothetical protein
VGTFALRARIPLLVGCVAVTGTAIPVAAHALIRPGISIAGAQVGATKSAVQNVLGAPISKADEGEPGVDSTNVTRWTYTKLTVFFQPWGSKGRVSRVETTRTTEKTALGIRPGSTRAAMKSAYPTAICVSGGRLCRIGGATVGFRYTEFVLTGAGVVKSIAVGIQGP